MGSLSPDFMSLSLGMEEGKSSFCIPPEGKLELCCVHGKNLWDDRKNKVT